MTSASADVITVHASDIYDEHSFDQTGDNGGDTSDENILQEPELQTAPWFQAGMPRY